MFSSALSGTLNAYRIFWAPATSTTLAVVVVIGVAYFGRSRIGVHSVAVGYVASEICRLLFLYGVLRKSGIGPIRLTLERWETLREFLQISSYMILGMVVAGLPPLINRMIASHCGPGSVSVVEYAEKMFYIPAGLLGSGFLTVVITHWSASLQEVGAKKLRNDVYLAVRLLAAGILIASVVLYALRYPLVSLGLGWGRIPQDSLMQVAQLYGVYLLGLLPNVIGLVLGRAHLVLRNTRVLLETALLGVGVLLLLDAWLAPRLGLTGIALATAGCHTAYTVYLFWTLEKSLRAQVVKLQCGTNTH
jgi:putative peptidoglycan lipid II flippase